MLLTSTLCLNTPSSRCFSAFPDSNSVEHSGDTIFNFRMRNSHFTQQLYLKQASSNTQDFDSAKNSGLPIDTDGFTYGSVFFRQQKDQEVKRGFFQKALVVLTPHPWPGLFRYIASMMGPLVMQSMVDTRKIDLLHPNGIQDITSLQTLHNACLEISSWSSPPFSWSSEQYYDSMSIPIRLLGKTRLFSFPPHNLFPQLYPLKSRTESMESFEKSKATLCNPGRFYQIFNSHLDQMWSCWELMVIGQPVYVLSDTPSASSQMVQCLVELIKPVPFGGDYRPYFTIQDSDFSSLASKNRVRITVHLNLKSLTESAVARALHKLWFWVSLIESLQKSWNIGLTAFLREKKRFTMTRSTF